MDDNRNTMNGAQAMVAMLAAHDVEMIFGLCGDTTLPLYDALAHDPRGIRHILCRDERSASYMADGYARVTGKVGVCEGPSGGGATYILPGLVEANESSQPMLAITTDVSTQSAGRYALTELDQAALFAPVTKWNGRIEHANLLPRMVRKAFREATSNRAGAVHLALPFDVQKANLDSDDVWGDPRFAQCNGAVSIPPSQMVEQLADVLFAAKRPVVICGGGVINAGACMALQEFAEFCDIVVATTISGQGSLACVHGNCLGVVGSNGGVVATREVVEQADVVLFIGCRAGSVTTERWRYPNASQTILHIDCDASVIGASYQTEGFAIGDALSALQQLLICAQAQPKAPKFGGAQIVTAAKAKKQAEFLPHAQSSDRPIRPEAVIHALQQVAPKDTIIVADPGTPCPYVSAYFDTELSGRHIISNRAHGALGYAMAASMGVQFAKPDAPVVCMMGDGSFGFTVGELETMVRYNLPITMIVFSNSVFGWIKAGQHSGFDKRYFGVDFDRVDHAKVANAYGIEAYTIDDPKDLAKHLTMAIKAPRPILLDIQSQPLHLANAPVSEWVA